MFLITSVLLLLVTYHSLFPMEPLPIITPSNSSSEVCFFINNIDHRLPQHYQLLKDIKTKLLTTYSAITNDERIASHTYNKLINISNYMNLDRKNKQIIQTLSNKKRGVCIRKINKKKIIVFPSHDQQQLSLNLRQNVRHTLAQKYSSMVLAPTTKRCWMNKRKMQSLSLEKNFYNGVLIISPAIILTALIIGYCRAEYCPLLCLLAIVLAIPGTALAIIIKEMYKSYKFIYSPINALELFQYNGYELLPLLPEENGKPLLLRQGFVGHGRVNEIL